MKLRTTQFDFRKGRIGPGLRIRQDTEAYRSGLSDAENIMILSDGGWRRRWGTFLRVNLGGDARIEGWNFTRTDTGRFILVFQNATLKIYDLTLTLIQTINSMPWDATTMRYLQVTFERTRCVITDTSFAPVFLDYDPDAGTFSTSTFAFQTVVNESRLQAPFYSFAADTMRVFLNIFTSAGTSTGYAAHIAAAASFDVADFDMTAGTGEILVEDDVFTADHEGTRMRIGGGEIEILEVLTAKAATVKVWKDVAVKLDPNPFYLRKSSNLVEVSAFNHGLRVGDKVFFFGLADGEASTLLRHAPKFAVSGSSSTVPSGTPRAYEVSRVIDENFFEIRADVTIKNSNATWNFSAHSFALWTNTGSGSGALPTNTFLDGGADVFMLPLEGMRGLTEPVYSPARGWPQACATHERRLWLAGSESLPDAAFGSQFAQFTNFDTGTGEPTDAVQAYGIGAQARIRHLVSAFDLQVLCDNGEFYIPGNTDTAVTQETLRVVDATEYGASYTIPRRFDGGTVFIDALGLHVRDFNLESRDKEYTAPPLSIVCADWIKGPDDTTVYKGSRHFATPYWLAVNSEDGSLLVAHSARGDDAFGFVRWTLSGGSFVSILGIDSRLFAVALRDDGNYHLIEFDAPSEAYTTCDFATNVTGAASSSWVVSEQAAPTGQTRELQMHAGGLVYSPVTLDDTGAFTTPEAVSDFVIGEAMPWLAKLMPPPINVGWGPMAGAMQRIVSIEIHWAITEAAKVEGEDALDALDNPAFVAPTPIDEWRQYWPGKWDREPTITISGETPGLAGMRAGTMTTYV